MLIVMYFDEVLNKLINNPVIGSWLDVVFHSCMISNNPVIGSWLDIVFSFIYNYYMLQIFQQNITLFKKNKKLATKPILK